MIGELVSHYRILEKLGEGGMGVVYRAKDIHLGRTVALKFLAPHITHSAQARQRLIREAQAASALDHPGICTIYEAGETDDGQAFIAMAYYQGSDLDERIRQGIRLEDSLGIALQIARAVEKAHQMGITHRDLKPQNIIITAEGEVKILDFGLAKLAGQTRLTQTGARVGTAAYMSPEQARGEPSDHRTDLWSLGVILYKMLSGDQPFRADYDEALLFAILNEPPREMTLQVELPPAVTRIVQRALQKDPRDRYQSAGEMIAELQTAASPHVQKVRRGFTQRPTIRLVTVGAAVLAIGVTTVLVTRIFPVQSEPPRILVAPFSNRTGDTLLNNLGIITAEWITDGLTRSGTLRVVPSDITYRLYGSMYRTDPAGAPEPGFSAAAREVKAEFVVSGSYYRHGQGLRFHAAISDVPRQTVVHSLEQVADELSHPERGLEELRERLTGVLVVIASHGEPDRPATLTRPMRFDALRKLIEAEGHFFNGQFGEAVPVYLQAHALDTTTVLPLLEAAVACFNLSEFERSDSLTRIVALRADGLNAHDGFLLKILQSWLAGDWTRAFLFAKEQAEIFPGTIAQYEWGHEGIRSNRPQETVTALETLDPAGVSMKGWFYYWRDLTVAHHMLGDHVIELEEARRGRRQYPDRIDLFECEIRALASLRDSAGVLELLEEATNLRKGDPVTLARLARVASAELQTHGAPGAARMAATRGLGFLRGDPATARSRPLRIITECDLLWELDRLEEARTVLGESDGGSAEDVRFIGRLGALAAALGDSVAVQQAITMLGVRRSTYDFGLRDLWRASIYAYAGRLEEAVSTLHVAFAAGWPSGVENHCSISLRPLHEHRSFRGLLAPRED